MEKTNAIRILDAKKIMHKDYFLEGAECMSGTEIAIAQNQDSNKVFKTLVTIGKSGNHYVFMLPVSKELDLKKAALAVNEKNIEMIKSKELLPLTGYVHGGCSPIGMKKFFTTTIHISAKYLDTIIFSAGKIGRQVEIKPSDLEKVIRVEYCDLLRD
ncbi:MAG: Cys-tRNA(Pro) deacylase [Clostridia bacterium]|nr:Cys-tRNA(Pro) deacylase [Clostridia bacterium]